MKALCLALALALLVPASLAIPAAEPAAGDPFAVVALIDTGLNPYNVAFRDPARTAHPCTYLPGYPCDAQPLVLSLGAASYEEAMELDAAVWSSVEANVLYYVPGTKIVGWLNLGGSGGARCEPEQPPLLILTLPGAACREERLLLDDHGHGSMTASRAAANEHSLCPACLIVEIEGLGYDGVFWAASQPWIDVQSNSWGFLLPSAFPTMQVPPTGCASNPDPSCLRNPRSVAVRLEEAAKAQPIFFASGNGIEFSGFAPTPTYLSSTYVPGVVLVGGHDNGRAALWSGAPAHVVADAFGGWAADPFSLTTFAPSPYACCTSTSAPYAAGGMAGLIVEARRLVGDTGVGNRGGFLALGSAPDGVTRGPLDDGRLSFEEARELFLTTAQARPQEGRDDGLLNFLADPRPPGEGDLLPYGPAGNPYCGGCFALPLAWRDLPAETDGAFAPHLGYGAINEFSHAQARAVMLGEQPLPARPNEAQWFAVDNALRSVFFP